MTEITPWQRVKAAKRRAGVATRALDRAVATVQVAQDAKDAADTDVAEALTAYHSSELEKLGISPQFDL